MVKRITYSLLIVIAFITMRCGLFEPKEQKGSICIKLVTETSNAKLAKAQESLSTVRCILKKGSNTIHDQEHTKSGGSFQIDINDLDPADNYSVLLYGKNSSGDIIGRGYQSGISVTAGETKNINMSWNKFVPENGRIISQSPLKFDWSDVAYATYELEVDNSSSFSSPEIHQTDLTSSNYTATSSLSDGKYYWRVRCKDSQGKWGGWSDTWNFTIKINTVATPTFNPSPGTYATAQDVTISCSTSGATIHYTTNGLDPTESDPVYSSPVYISSTKTLKARAYKSGWTPSDVASGLYTITGKVATPTFSPSPGTYTTAQNVTISCATSGATIHYTTNSSDPTESDPVYSSPVSISSTTTLKARAYKSGWTPSDVASGTYIILITGTVTDIDGNGYQTVKIGDQWWMAENLKVTHYRSGDVIPNNVISDTEWGDLTSGAYCDYDNNYSNYVATYGRLYNWYAVDDSRNIAPEGWHVPSDDEWKELEMYLGMSQTDVDENKIERGTDEGGKLKETGTAHWKSPNTGATNERGFSALPGGLRNTWYGYSHMSENAYFWTSTYSYTSENESGYAWYRRLDYESSYVARLKPGNVQSGLSVRCVKGENQTPNTAPTASFNVTPSSGYTDTQFSFDASGCSDSEDDTSQLQVRWDWESDGVWDTYFSITKTASHQFNSAGTYTVTLEVKDTGGLTDQMTKNVILAETGTLTDIDGNVYQTVKIGNQWWMAENLKVTHYRNGDAIPNVIDNSTWAALTTGAYCNYNNDTNNATTYGSLYNWYAVNDSRNIAPTGWHVPSDAEWQTLVDYLGGSDVAGGKLKEPGTTHWQSPNTGATNESGFSALPGGLRNIYGGYEDIGYEANFWSSTEDNSTSAGYRCMHYNYSGVNRYFIYCLKAAGISVRCIRDN